VTAEDIAFFVKTVVEGIDRDRENIGHEDLPKNFKPTETKVGVVGWDEHDHTDCLQVLAVMRGTATEGGKEIPYAVEAIFLYDPAKAKFYTVSTDGYDFYDLETWLWDFHVAEDGSLMPRGDGGLYEKVVDENWINA